MSRTYPPFCKCIYCGSYDEKLTREHIIPFSLGGNLVLPAASCEACADVTKRIEQKVAQDTYGIHRAYTLAPSRRKKHRHQETLARKVQVQGVDFNGNSVTALVPVQELPRLPMAVELMPPKLLLPGRPDNDGQEVKLHCEPLEDDPKFTALRDKLNWSSVSVRSPSVDPVKFMRVLAKIAHSFTCAEIPERNFRAPLPSIILGTGGELGHYIGGFSPQLPQRQDALWITHREIDDRNYLVVEISLHFFDRLPRYQVISGII